MGRFNSPVCLAGGDAEQARDVGRWRRAARGGGGAGPGGVRDTGAARQRAARGAGHGLAPLLGWDGAGCRLGYGAGYFDRTLAALDPFFLFAPKAAQHTRL